VREARWICRSATRRSRSDLHTGEIELNGDDIAGIAVHIGNRASSHAGAGEVFVSRTVADLIAAPRSNSMTR
jgi:class 3 adenylate cyclase